MCFVLLFVFVVVVVVVRVLLIKTISAQRSSSKCKN